MKRGDKLGEGTFGIVYAASSPRTKRQYAVKRNLVEDGTSFIGVSREVCVLNKLRNHPNIVRLEQVSIGHPFNGSCFSPLAGQDRISQRDDSLHFVFKEASYDLYRFIYGSRTHDFRLIKQYMVDILLAVEFMHCSQRIIHRDLKPSNILIFTNERNSIGRYNIASICDFGLAKPYTYQGYQTPGAVTSWYRAPEIALGYPHYDYKIDIWSLGCIFYEMIAGKSFVSDIPDNNDDILSAILGSLPEELSMRKFRELIKSNKWRQIKLTPAHSPRVRRSFYQQLGLSSKGLAQFEREAGKIQIFCDLISNMLKFEWDQRFTATQCLEHPFFHDMKYIISETRKLYPPVPKKESPYNIHNCIERVWVSQMIIDIFNNRCNLPWYSDRSLFQAMDLFDRYLYVMFHNTEIPPNAVESDLKGFIHDKFGTELRFMTCLHLCVKYFSSIHYPIPFDDMVTEEFRTPEAKLIAENFEGGLITSCLGYNIYRMTLYEAADQFNDKLDHIDIRNLIILYSMNNSFTGLTPIELYRYYREHLKNKDDIELLRAPIPTK